MHILGIETSCDETAAAVVKDGKIVLSNIIASSLKDHQPYGGIIPEIASRRQLELISAVIQRSLKVAGRRLSSIDAVAVTQGPGLIGSLLVGISYARALSYAAQKPLAEIDHIKAHLYANFLLPLKKKRGKKRNASPALPAVGLIVSGGHTALYAIENFAHFRLMGQTRDDAAGEAFDKVARILDLGYPGGPVIERLARNVKETSIRFPQAELPGTLDFSFSGIKTSVLTFKQAHRTRCSFPTNEVAYAFQKSVVGILVKKCLLACRQEKVKSLLVGGGVAANTALRQELERKAGCRGIRVSFPERPLCMDNAAMIAGFAYHTLNK